MFVGDRRTGNEKKLAPQFVGPVFAEEEKSPNSWVIRHPFKPKTRTVIHGSKLKRAHLRKGTKLEEIFDLPIEIFKRKPYKSRKEKKG